MKMNCIHGKLVYYNQQTNQIYMSLETHYLISATIDKDI